MAEAIPASGFDQYKKKNLFYKLLMYLFASLYSHLVLSPECIVLYQLEITYVI